jgi:hypothetical protein
MVTVVIHTTLPIETIDVSGFVEDLGRAATTAFDLPPQMRSIYLNAIPVERGTVKEGYHATFLLFTAPGKTIDHRRAMVKALNDVVQGRSWGKKVQVVVIIKEHEPDFVGVNGVLRIDSK